MGSVAALNQTPTPFSAEPDRDVFAGAEVYKVTSSIAFLRATAFQTEGDPIANAVATFMLGANAPKYNARQG